MREQLPRPEMYDNWKTWAAALLAALGTESPPAVSGAKGGNVALTNLLKVLAEQSVVDDQTS